MAFLGAISSVFLSLWIMIIFGRNYGDNLALNSNYKNESAQFQ